MGTYLCIFFFFFPLNLSFVLTNYCVHDSVKNSNNGSTVLLDLDSFIKFGEAATCTRNSRVTQVKVVLAATNYIIVPFVEI